MEEEHRHQKSHESETTVAAEEVAVETQDRGLFDLLGKKKEEKPQEEVIVTEFEKVQVSEPVHKIEEPKVEGEKKHSLLEKLHRSDSSSSSSSDEEEGEGGEKKKKKKKGLKEKILGEKKAEEDTTVPIEKCDVVAPPPPEEKKGFLEKIKDKLPGQHKKAEEVAPPHPPPPPPPVECAAEEAHGHEGDPAKEKKGILEKIKEKLPGYHQKTEEEKKDEPASH